VTGLLFLLLAVLVIVAGIAARRRVREATRGGVTDDIVRQIETVGRVEAEEVEALDVEEARSEEDEFWSQTWDEPDQTL